jgi:hypothetical protein
MGEKREKTPSLSSSSSSGRSSFHIQDENVNRNSVGSVGGGGGDLEIFLDRSAEPYDIVLHFIRTGELPRSVRLHDFVYRHHHHHYDGNGGKQQIDRFSLYPVMARLEDAKEEASWLGLTQLEKSCKAELDKLRGLLLKRKMKDDDEDREGWI